MELATFLHISDLHIGLTGPEGRDARAPRFWASMSWFDGLLGHSFHSLSRLCKFYRSMSSRPLLIMTGDFTTCCREQEFQTAEKFLGSKLTPSPVGLSLPNWKDLAIPGNHDHWSGYPTIFGGPGPAFHRRFSLDPTIAKTISLSSGHKVTFLRINTDADVWPYGKLRFLAQGSFLSQLSQMENMLDSPEEKEIRVLLLHHSRAARGHTLTPLIMTDKSRHGLDQFIANNRIAVLLCGHVHQPPLLDLFSVTQHGIQSQHLEARCGTTTQRSLEPYEWRLVRERSVRPGDLPNSLIVHRILATDQGLNWQCAIYLETPEGFVPATEAGKPELHPKTIRIWPRAVGRPMA